MKLILMGDFHYTDRQPRLRKDNFFEALKAKIEFILELAKKNDAYILQPGDWFDSHKASYSSFSKLLKLLKIHSPLLGILTVYGQHDLRFHKSDIENTPLNALNESFPHIFIAPNIGEFVEPNSNIRIRGCSWNEEVKIPFSKDNKNILLTHRMIYEEKDYPGQETQGYSANVFLRKHKEYSLIVSGDNHKSFTAKVGNRYLVNCGALMRTAVDMENHRPCCYIYDSEKNTIEQVLIPCAPFSEVFDFERHELEKKVDNEKLEAYVRSLSTGERPVELDFVKAMKSKLEKAELSDGVKTIIEEIMQ
jgi:DNA repair exonuclease SbcCD nuclease subunit